MNTTVVRENREADRAQNEQFFAPSASVVEASDGYTLEVEMPGGKQRRPRDFNREQ
jgi:HSP20 family molecular chaperone IbpA